MQSLSRNLAHHVTTLCGLLVAVMVLIIIADVEAGTFWQFR